MSQAELNDWIVFGVKASLILFVLAYGRKILGIVRESFGRVDKTELLSMIMTPVLIYMIHREGSRDHEWELYSPYLVGIISVMIAYGFGLKPILKYFLLLRGVDPKSLDEKPDKQDPADSDSATTPDDGESVVK